MAAAKRSTPWGVRAVLLLIGVVAGVFGAVLVATALLPRVAADTVDVVEASWILPDEVELSELRERSVVYDADGELLSVLRDAEDRLLVPFEVLPDHVWQAVVTAEDRRFFEHEGYDPEGLGRALLANIEARGIAEGGSTITQQLAKINFLDDRQTVDRKYAELLYAMALEERHDKEELLERYLNQVYFGQGAYGVQAAAEEYFGIGAEDLSVDQAALLAGTIRAPGRLDPREEPERAHRRRDAILAGMADEGYLSPTASAWLRRQDTEVLDERPEEIREPYVVAAVKQEFLRDPAHGATFEERVERLFGGGLEIRTTIDPGLQDIAGEVVAEHYPDDEPTAALAAVDPATGAVRAVHSGHDFEEEQFDLARQGRRSPGSAYKTFVMLEALRQGYPSDLEFDSPNDIEIEFDDGRQTWEPTNYGNASFGRIDLAEATNRSVNTYYAQLAMLVGVDEVVELTEELGIDRAAAYRGEEYPSISLGGLEGGVSPLEMASAYAALANGGAVTEPHFIDEIREDGEVVYAAEPTNDDVLPEAVAAKGVELLKGTVEEGTGTAARLEGWEVAGKTGTTNRNTDAWFAGLTPVLSTAVWVGHPGEQVTMPGGTGGQLAAPVWADFMRRALEDVEPEPFPEFDEDELRELFADELVEVPDVVGEMEDEAVAILAEERLTADVAEVDSLQPAGLVLHQDPSGGEEQPAAVPVQLLVSSGEAPVKNVPDVIGLGRDAAFDALHGVGYDVEVVTVADEASAGTVIDQSPGAGTSLPIDQNVRIVLSSGPPEEEDDEDEADEDEADEGEDDGGEDDGDEADGDEDDGDED